MWWLQIVFFGMGGCCLDDVLIDEIGSVWGLENERVWCCRNNGLDEKNIREIMRKRG